MVRRVTLFGWWGAALLPDLYVDTELAKEVAIFLMLVGAHWPEVRLFWRYVVVRKCLTASSHRASRRAAAAVAAAVVVAAPPERAATVAREAVTDRFARLRRSHRHGHRLGPWASGASGSSRRSGRGRPPTSSF
tara:strand:- start:2967 stop:3368 length:402 start_codon:yes stop_codon:yes gene_type:complete